jgi:hypothetical protein
MGFIGRLEDMSFPDIVQMLSMSRRTGKLTLTEGASRAFVIFRQGDIVAASLGRGRETLGCTLVRGGFITESTLNLALDVQKNLLPDRLLGTILVEMNAVDPQRLSEVVREQIEDVLAELVTWENGSFKFEPMALGEAMTAELENKELVVPAGLRAEHAMLEAMRRKDERTRDDVDQPQNQSATPTPPPPPLPFAPPRKRATVEAPLASPSPEAPEVFSPAQLVGLLLQAQREQEESVGSGLGVPSATAVLKSIMEEGRGARSVPELALLIMRCATAVVNRGVLLSIDKGVAHGMGQFGLEVTGARANSRVREIKIPLNEPSVFAEVAQQMRSFRGKLPHCKWNDYIVAALGEVEPEEAAVVPMLVNNTVRLMFYGDNLPERVQLGNVEILEMLMLYAGIEMEKVLLESVVGE